MGRGGYHLVRMGVSAVVLCLAMPACALSAEREHFDLPAQDLARSVRALVDQSGATSVAPPARHAGLRAPALRGEFTPEQALARLIAGTPLRVARVGDALVLQRVSADRAQDATAPGAGDSEIVVTGTRIRGRAPAGAAVTTIDRSDIEQSGYATTQQILQALPQNFGGGPNETTAATARGNADFNSAFGSGINLRGLGASSTLVLLDGERPPMAGLAGVFTDLSLIPLSAIGRIEVLPDGASALYGSDAVAGVVNIVPRSDVEGLETTGRFGFGDGLTEWQASALAGHRWSSGSFLVGYEFYRRSALATADRPYVSEDLRPFGLGDYRSGAAVPGTIIAGGRSFVIPAGQDGRSLTPSDLAADQRNVSDRYLGADALPMQRRHAVLATVRQQVGPFELYGQALFGVRNFDLAQPARYNTATVTVPTSNPFYVDPLGIGQPVQVQYSYRHDIGNERMRGTSRALGLSAGARLALGSWELDTHGTYGRQRETTTSYNLVNSARAAAALADTDPDTALNVFGDGSANNPATLDTIRGSIRSGGTYHLWGAQFRAEGPLIALPAGDIRLAAGIEHREERYALDKGILDTSTLTPLTLASDWTGRRDVTAGYVELSAPLSGEAGMGLDIGGLDVSAALRGERYSDFGDTLNPKLGLSWTPLPSLTFRASWGTSFRAPNFQDLRQDPNVILYFAYPVPDPAAPGGVTNALIIRGNDPDLGPEKARSWTIGADFNLRASRGPFARLTYFDIDYRNRIASPASALLSYFTNRTVYAPIIDDTPDPAVIADYFASPYFLRLSAIDASQVTAIVDARTQNLARQHQHGFDFDLGYRMPIADGTAEVGLNGSWLLAFEQQLTSTAPTIDLVDTIGNPPDLRLRARASYGSDRFSGALFVNYLDGYRNTLVTPEQPVGAWTTVDLQFGFRPALVSGLTLSLSVTNLLDEDPPHLVYAVGSNTIGYDVENASPLGRLVSLQVSKQW